MREEPRLQVLGERGGKSFFYLLFCVCDFMPPIKTDLSAERDILIKQIFNRLRFLGLATVSSFNVFL